MKKLMFIIFCILVLSTNKVSSQNSSLEIQLECWNDTTLLFIENIEEYLFVSKSLKNKQLCIVVYIVKARYAEKTHEKYMTPLILVSLDTVNINKVNKSFYRVNGIERNHNIQVGGTYLFHIELCGCLPIVGGISPNSFDIDGISIPVQLCPLQPYRTKDLNGLEYCFIRED